MSRKFKIISLSLSVLLLFLIALGTVYYFFYVKEDPSASNQKQEIIIPPPLPEKIVVYGDTRSGHEMHRIVTSLILKEEPDAVFHTGDLVNDGTITSEWTIFNEIAGGLISSTDYYPSLGNHEKNSILYYNNFDLPNNEQWYSVEKDNAHFIVLNSNKSLSIGSSQYTWLENDLKNTDEEKFIIAVFHHPPVSTGSHDEDEMRLKTSIIPLFEEYGVDMVFGGHDHNYERSLYNGIYYIVAGGGGAPVYVQTRTSPYSQKFLSIYHYCLLEISEDKIDFSVYDYESNLIDEVEIR